MVMLEQILETVAVITAQLVVVQVDLHMALLYQVERAVQTVAQTVKLVQEDLAAVVEEQNLVLLLVALVAMVSLNIDF
jgi:hypothetical protein